MHCWAKTLCKLNKKGFKAHRFDVDISNLLQELLVHKIAPEKTENDEENQ